MILDTCTAVWLWVWAKISYPTRRQPHQKVSRVGGFRWLRVAVFTYRVVYFSAKPTWAPPQLPLSNPTCPWRTPPNSALLQASAYKNESQHKRTNQIPSLASPAFSLRTTRAWHLSVLSPSPFYYSPSLLPFPFSMPSLLVRISILLTFLQV